MVGDRAGSPPAPCSSAHPDPDRIYREIDRVLAFAGGRPNCLLGTGALPLETPPANIRLIKNYLAG